MSLTNGFHVLWQRRLAAMLTQTGYWGETPLPPLNFGMVDDLD